MDNDSYYIGTFTDLEKGLLYGQSPPPSGQGASCHSLQALQHLNRGGKGVKSPGDAFFEKSEWGMG